MGNNTFHSIKMLIHAHYIFVGCKILNFLNTRINTVWGPDESSVEIAIGLTPKLILSS
jgi:hypothetical protein